MRRIIIISPYWAQPLLNGPNKTTERTSRGQRRPPGRGHPNTTILVPFVDRDTRVAENKGVEEGEEPDVGSTDFDEVSGEKYTPGNYSDPRLVNLQSLVNAMILEKSG